VSAIRGRRRAVSAPAAAFLVGLTLAGCAGPLPFRPEQQPSGLTISAGVALRETRLLVTIASDGYRVEQAALVREDGRLVLPESLVPPTDSPSSGLSVGVGLGGGSVSSSGGISVGTGIGVGTGGPFREATTLAVFRRDEAGAPPWRLRVKVVGVEPVDIVIDPTRSGQPAGGSSSH
jgi:hypothetical protein